jgi:hopanoid biosynthesis associated RND transporter like protein HpnN
VGSEDEPKSPVDAASTGVTGVTGTTLAERFTAWIAHRIVTRPVTVIVVATVLTAAAALFAWFGWGRRLPDGDREGCPGLILDLDRNNLIGRELEYNKRFIALEKEFGDLAAMTVVAEARTRDRCKEFAEDLRARCVTRPDLFGTVFYRVPLEELENRALVFAQLGDLNELRTTLEDTNLFARLERGGGIGGIFDGLATHVKNKVAQGDQDDPGGGEDMGGILYGVLDGIEGAVKKGTPYRTPWKDVVDDGYAWAKPGVLENSPTSLYGKDGRRLIILIPPVPHKQGMDDSEVSVHALRALLETYRNNPKWQDLQLGLTGGPVLAVDEGETYNHDATVSTIVGFVAVILLFMISFRRVLGPICAGICLAMAIAFTLAFATIWPGHLNLISIVFLEILIGLGIDFGIHLISRYDEERTYGMQPGPALEAALGLTGRASAAGAMTTALAFMATLFADFKGIQEFGVIAAVGILCCLATMLLVLPAMIVIADRGAGGLKRRPRPGWARTRLAVKLDHWAIRRPWRLVLVSLVFLVIALTIGHYRLHYSGNLLDLQATNLESVRYANDLVQGDTIANLVAETPAELEKYAAEMRELKDVVDHVECVPVQQQEKLVEIRKIAGLVADVRSGSSPEIAPPSNDADARAVLAGLCDGVSKFHEELEAAQGKAASTGAAHKEDVNEIQKILDRLDHILEAADPSAADPVERARHVVAYENPFRAELLELGVKLRSESSNAQPIKPADLPPVLRDRFVGKTGKLLMHIYPKKAIFDDAPLEEFISKIRTKAPELTGVPVQIYETGKRMKEGYEKAGYFALILIAIYLIFHFRSLAFGLITLSALLVGTGLGVGLLGLKGETLNPANMLAIPLTLGIGVCYAIQLVHRYRQARARPSVAGAQPVIATSTGRGVILSAGTNVVAFGALALAHHRGTASIGYAITFGVLGCLVAALLFLPAIMRLWTGPVDSTPLGGVPGPKVGPDGKPRLS